MAEAWSEAEVRGTVADYLDMLRDELAGRAYSKAAHRAELRSRLSGRTDAAIEFKHQNISAVLDERGLTWILGYRPAKNYQRSLAAEIDRQFRADPDLLASLSPTLGVAFEALVGNKAIESAAIAWVMELERAAGRSPIDRRYVAAFAGDIESSPRTIEVKAFGTTNRGFGLWLEVPQVEAVRRDPQFFVYVVENVRQGNPAKFTLKVLGGERLRQLLLRAKERRYFEVPLPVADYDSTTGEEEL